MDQAASFRNGGIEFEHLKDSDLEHLPFDTPAHVERYYPCCGMHQVGLRH